MENSKVNNQLKNKLTNIFKKIRFNVNDLIKSKDILTLKNELKKQSEFIVNLNRLQFINMYYTCKNKYTSINDYFKKINFYIEFVINSTVNNMLNNINISFFEIGNQIENQNPLYINQLLDLYINNIINYMTFVI